MKTFVFRHIYELARSVERFLYLFQFVADDLEEGIMEGVMINNLINVIHIFNCILFSSIHFREIENSKEQSAKD